MNFKIISGKIRKIETDFIIAIKDFKNDQIFNHTSNIYLKSEKIILYKKWKRISKIFSSLKKIIHQHSFGFFTTRNHNNFIIKHYCIVLYYNMTLKLQESFKTDEHFIRSFLDENYKENYSTIARYIYRGKFLYYLNYPPEFLKLIESNIDKDLKWMLGQEKNYSIKLDFEYQNFYYYIIHKFSIISKFFIKYIGLFLASIHFKTKGKGQIGNDIKNLCKEKLIPGDILISRTNYVATNISIPGFWKHMAMYIGTGNFIKTHFNIPPGMKLEKDTQYIIEATGKGVQIDTIDNFLNHLDYCGVLRTTFSETKIHSAIGETLSFINKEYDYLFNYYSDTSFVCSELITKAYLKDSRNDEGLNIELVKISTGLTYPPNNFITKINNDISKNIYEVIPILFIDSNKKNFFINTQDELLKSNLRPRLSFFLK